VSLTRNGELLVLKELNDGNYSHAEFLNEFISEVLEEANIKFKDLSAVAISKGPGSYTGLRIGVSTAKGLCYALDIPLISIDTMEILAHSISIDSGVIVAMLDARRMEVYHAVFDANKNLIQPTEAIVLSHDTYLNYLVDGYVHFVGDAVFKSKEVVKHSHAIFDENTFPSAREMGNLSFNKFVQKDFEDVAYFEPFYLKDFIALKKI
jgi:tRNA threonylcarbamoyladenosine biosynthesis protein TsaB